MGNYLWWTFVLAILALLGAGLAVFIRAYMGGTTPAALLFRPKSERRLEVIDHANLDSRRKLVLIRRDDVEHLLLTGGPVDVVIETGISGAVKRVPEAAAAREPGIARRPPAFGRSTDPGDPQDGTL
jgi:flagellar protein FliO/FliZ